MLAGQYKYLVCIGVNNRYATVIPLNVIHDILMTEKYKEISTVQINLELLLLKLPDGMKTFYSDAEPSFLALKNYLESYGVILIAEPDQFHTRLAIINRFIRTLRDMAFNKFSVEDQIKPNQMKELVLKYNNAYHTTLSKVIGFQVSPKDVLLSSELEAFLVKKLLVKKFLKNTDNKLSIGAKVAVYQAPKPFEKTRSNVLEGEWTITDIIGNKYKVSEKQGEEMIVPRWAIK
jgi:hypothetical protein